ncbi:hypothetical protein KI387_017537 [Taxus chinensis]|uniref:Uncharacterized protein n=1 Tax=Taxus chinensis TaxID=29808 RepID=A0AA38GJ98_TAXCH|nr:hypothetical protein KI387_017537 [Taxus chinensis]
MAARLGFYDSNGIRQLGFLKKKPSKGRRFHLLEKERERSKAVCESVMDGVDHELQLRKAPIRAGSSLILTNMAPMKSYSVPAPFRPARMRLAPSLAHISIIPSEARGKKKGSGFESLEPASPMVSCIGKVKLKKIPACKTNIAGDNNGSNSNRECSVRSSLPAKETSGELGKNMSKLRKIFAGKKLTEKPVSVAEARDAVKENEGNNYPSLGQMKRFATRRELSALANIYAQGLVYDKEK